MPRHREPGQSRGVTHPRCGTDEWKMRGRIAPQWSCVKCERDRALGSYHRNHGVAWAKRDQKIAEELDLGTPTKEERKLPVAPLTRAVERHLWLRSRDGEPARMDECFTDAAMRAFYRAKKDGHITPKAADKLLDAMDMHGRELWGDDYDRAVWGGELPADFWPSDDVRRLGQVEQARASFANRREWALTTVDVIEARRRARLSDKAERWETAHNKRRRR